MTYEIAGRQLVMVSILVLYLGYFITLRSGFLQRNNIPVSVTGGLVFSIFAALLAATDVVQLTFDLKLRGFSRLIFFSTIGLNAKFCQLLTGGLALVVLGYLSINLRISQLGGPVRAQLVRFAAR